MPESLSRPSRGNSNDSTEYLGALHRRPQRRGSRSEPARDLEQVLRREYEAPDAQTLGRGQLRTVHAPREIHHHARSRAGPRGGGAQLAPGLRGAFTVRKKLRHRIPQDAPGAAAWNQKSRREPGLREKRGVTRPGLAPAIDRPAGTGRLM